MQNLGIAWGLMVTFTYGFLNNHDPKREKKQ
jgi:hypothetical protein